MRASYLLVALVIVVVGAMAIPLLLRRREPTPQEAAEAAEEAGADLGADVQGYAEQGYAGFIGFQKGLFGTAVGDEWSDWIAPLAFAEWLYGEEIY